MNYKIYNNDCLKQLEDLEENSIDSIVTDPPYELNFMGKGWDNAGVSFNKETWEKCLRVLKPGGYLLAFGGSRTYHRIAVAIEDAGFEIRDTIMYLYGSGFPKSQNIGKQLEKRLNNEKTKQKTKHDLLSMWERDIQKTKSNEKTNEMVLQSQLQEQSLQVSGKTTSDVWGEQSSMERWSNIQKAERELQWCQICEMSKRVSINGEERWICNGTQNCNGEALREMFDKNGSCPSYRPQPEQQFNRELNAIQEQWGTQACREVIENWKKIGTALKPSYEPIIVARKPFKGSLVDNVIEYGVGGINIDECRVETNDINRKGGATTKGNLNWKPSTKTYNDGRFPANTILTYDESDFDEVCGGFPNTKSQKRSSKYNKDTEYTNTYTPVRSDYRDDNTYNDSGSAARYFYCAKASKKDRDCNGTIRNIHPTCKPCNLMQYLVRLVTPKDGTILDPFMGSGSTGKAVMYENKERNANYKFIGIEREKEYCDIAEARIKYASKFEEGQKEKDKQITFDDLK